MWLTKLLFPLTRVISGVEDRRKAKECLADLVKYIESYSNTCNGELELKLGILEKMYSKFEKFADNSISLIFFIDYLLSLSVIYLKISHERSIYISDIVEIFQNLNIAHVVFDQKFFNYLAETRNLPQKESKKWRQSKISKTKANDNQINSVNKNLALESTSQTTSTEEAFSNATPCSTPDIELNPEFTPCLVPAKVLIGESPSCSNSSVDKKTDESDNILRAILLMLKDFEISVLYDLEYNTSLNYSKLIEIFHCYGKSNYCLQLEEEIRQCKEQDGSPEFNKFREAIRSLYYGSFLFSRLTLFNQRDNELSQPSSFVSIDKVKFQQFSSLKEVEVEPSHDVFHESEQAVTQASSRV